MKNDYTPSQNHSHLPWCRRSSDETGRSSRTRGEQSRWTTWRTWIVGYLNAAAKRVRRATIWVWWTNARRRHPSQRSATIFLRTLGRYHAQADSEPALVIGYPDMRLRSVRLSIAAFGLASVRRLPLALMVGGLIVAGIDLRTHAKQLNPVRQRADRQLPL